LAETGAHPVLVATGETSSAFKDVIGDLTRGLIPKAPLVRQGVDFHDVAQTAADLAPDLLLGHSKGFGYAREFNIPLVRVGFPVHDRFGGPRILHLGHAGALNLFDRLVNACLEHKQSASPVGYGYM
jgi:nitrogenase molybdenum-iron protein NifN